MINKNKLPHNWEVKEIGELGKVKGGKRLPKGEVYSETKTNFPYIRVTDFCNQTINQNNLKFLKPSTQKSIKNYTISKDDVFISIAGTIGETGIIPNNLDGANLTENAAKITELNNINKIYLSLFLSSIFGQSQIKQKTISTTQPKLALYRILKIAVPLPPLPDQHRIVAKLEQLFSELDKANESFKIAKELLKTYRQSVLKYAFEGRFTNKDIKKGELPDGWKWVKLGEVSDKIQDGSHFSPQVQYDAPGKDRYMYITAKNIRNNYMDLSKITWVDKKFHESIYCRCNPEYNDVLLTKDGVNTGEVTLNTLHESFSLLSSVCIFKVKKDVLKSEYLKYFIQSPFGSKVITSSMTGTAIKRIILRKIKDAEISLPPFDEQHTIVQKIEQRLSECDKMEETLDQSLKQSETLRQSILKQAFEGKLVPQDPNDEPAKKLLEKIKTEKEKIDTTTKKIIRKKK